MRWIDKDKPSGYILVDQNVKVEELESVLFDHSLKDDVVCTPDLHTQYRSVLGQINWLQSRTQYQSCYEFSRCASTAAAPKIGDCRKLNLLVKRIRGGVDGDLVDLRFYKLRGQLRIIAYPDAAYQNNKPDRSSQRGAAIFLAEQRYSGCVDAKASLVDYESTKIKKAVHSTTMAELYALFRVFGTSCFLKGLWMDMSGQNAELHMRTDANNLVTTAKTTRQPEQRETQHLINQLRFESCSGSIDDLAHVVTTEMMADCLTKESIKPDALVRAVRTGVLKNVDSQPSFRELIKDKHKAFSGIQHYHLAEWCLRNLGNTRKANDSYSPLDIETFLGVDISHEINFVHDKPTWYVKWLQCNSHIHGIVTTPA